KDYFKVAQGAQANKVKMSITSHIVSVDSYRVTGEWTYEAEDDLSSLYDLDAETALIDEMSRMLAWVTDRTMIDTAADVASVTKTWDANPPGYSNLVPSEKKAYDETIYRDGILPLITAIQAKRAFNLTPNWAVAGPVA